MNELMQLNQIFEIVYSLTNGNFVSSHIESMMYRDKIYK